MCKAILYRYTLCFKPKEGPYDEFLPRNLCTGGQRIAGKGRFIVEKCDKHVGEVPAHCVTSAGFQSSKCKLTREFRYIRSMCRLHYLYSDNPEDELVTDDTPVKNQAEMAHFYERLCRAPIVGMPELVVSNDKIHGKQLTEDDLIWHVPSVEEIDSYLRMPDYNPTTASQVELGYDNVSPRSNIETQFAGVLNSHYHPGHCMSADSHDAEKVAGRELENDVPASAEHERPRPKSGDKVFMSVSHEPNPLRSHDRANSQNSGNRQQANSQGAMPQGISRTGGANTVTQENAPANGAAAGGAAGNGGDKPPPRGDFAFSRDSKQRVRRSGSSSSSSSSKSKSPEDGPKTEQRQEPMKSASAFFQPSNFTVPQQMPRAPTKPLQPNFAAGFTAFGANPPRPATPPPRTAASYFRQATFIAPHPSDRPRAGDHAQATSSASTAPLDSFADPTHTASAASAFSSYASGNPLPAATATPTAGNNDENTSSTGDVDTATQIRRLQEQIAANVAEMRAFMEDETHNQETPMPDPDAPPPQYWTRAGVRNHAHEARRGDRSKPFAAQRYGLTPSGLTPPGYYGNSYERIRGPHYTRLGPHTDVNNEGETHPEAQEDNGRGATPHYPLPASSPSAPVPGSFDYESDNQVVPEEPQDNRDAAASPHTPPNYSGRPVQPPNSIDSDSLFAYESEVEVSSEEQQVNGTPAASSSPDVDDFVVAPEQQEAREAAASSPPSGNDFVLSTEQQQVEEDASTSDPSSNFIDPDETGDNEQGDDERPEEQPEDEPEEQQDDKPQEQGNDDSDDQQDNQSDKQQNDEYEEQSDDDDDEAARTASAVAKASRLVAQRHLASAIERARVTANGTHISDLHPTASYADDGRRDQSQFAIERYYEDVRLRARYELAQRILRDGYSAPSLDDDELDRRLNEAEGDVDVAYFQLQEELQWERNMAQTGFTHVNGAPAPSRSPPFPPRQYPQNNVLYFQERLQYQSRDQLGPTQQEFYDRLQGMVADIGYEDATPEALLSALIRAQWNVDQAYIEFTEDRHAERDVNYQNSRDPLNTRNARLLHEPEVAPYAGPRDDYGVGPIWPSNGFPARLTNPGRARWQAVQEFLAENGRTVSPQELFSFFHVTDWDVERVCELLLRATEDQARGSPSGDLGNGRGDGFEIFEDDTAGPPPPPPTAAEVVAARGARKKAERDLNGACRRAAPYDYRTGPEYSETTPPSTPPKQIRKPLPPSTAELEAREEARAALEAAYAAAENEAALANAAQNSPRGSDETIPLIGDTPPLRQPLGEWSPLQPDISPLSARGGFDFPDIDYTRSPVDRQPVLDANGDITQRQYVLTHHEQVRDPLMDWTQVRREGLINGPRDVNRSPTHGLTEEQVANMQRIRAINPRMAIHHTGRDLGLLDDMRQDARVQGVYDRMDGSGLFQGGRRTLWWAARPRDRDPTPVVNGGPVNNSNVNAGAAAETNTDPNRKRSESPGPVIDDVDEETKPAPTNKRPKTSKDNATPTTGPKTAQTTRSAAQRANEAIRGRNNGRLRRRSQIRQPERLGQVEIVDLTGDRPTVTRASRPRTRARPRATTANVAAQAPTVEVRPDRPTSRYALRETLRRPVRLQDEEVVEISNEEFQKVRKTTSKTKGKKSAGKTAKGKAKSNAGVTKTEGNAQKKGAKKGGKK